MTGVFQRECDCGVARTKEGLLPERHKTDDAAVASAWRHWTRRLGGEPAHRYWLVHGPSGHLVGLRDTPMGQMPPLPMSVEQADPRYVRPP